MPAEAREHNDNYILQRDTYATSRYVDMSTASSIMTSRECYMLRANADMVFPSLNHQYFLWQQTLGFTLAPEVPKPGPGSKVADVATGSG